MSSFVFVLFSLFSGIPEEIDVPALKGLTIDQLQKIVPIKKPENPNWEVGVLIDVKNWRGWPKTTFSFNGKGRLSSVTFYLPKPMSSDKAEALAVSKLGLTLPPANRVVAPILLAYRNLGSPIRTVNFICETQPGNNNAIETIGVFFSIRWSE